MRVEFDPPPERATLPTGSTGPAQAPEALRASPSAAGSDGPEPALRESPGLAGLAHRSQMAERRPPRRAGPPGPGTDCE